MKSDINSKITIIIPAKNEEHTIGKVLDKILLSFGADNVVVIVDEAADRTVEIAKQKNVKAMVSGRKGKGSAIKFAIDKIICDILVFIDADGSHEPEDIPKLIQPILDDEADLVIASRMEGGSEELSGSLNNTLRCVGNIVSSGIINFIWGKGDRIIADCQNGFRAIKKGVANQIKLKEDSFAIEQEMVIKCIKMGFRIREVPSYELKRQYGNSRVSCTRMLPIYMWCLIKNIG